MALFWYRSMEAAAYQRPRAAENKRFEKGERVLVFHADFARPPTARVEKSDARRFAPTFFIPALVPTKNNDIFKKGIPAAGTAQAGS